MPFVIFTVIRKRLEACCKVAVYLLLSGKLLTFGPEVSPEYPKLFIQEYLCQRPEVLKPNRQFSKTILKVFFFVSMKIKD